jgi:hypothetical protein
MTRKSLTRKVKTARGIRAPARPLRATKAHAIETLVVATAQTLALPLDPAWHNDVKRNLRLLCVHAALIDDFTLPDESEPAPVFRA